MKLLQQRRAWALRIYFSTLFLALILLLFFPSVAWYCTRLNWLCLPICVGLLFHPLSRQKLTSSHPKSMPFWAWSLRILSLQIASQFLLWGLMQNQVPIPLPLLAHFTVKTWGFYPWPLYLIGALLLRHKHNSLSAALMPQHKTGSKSHLVVDFYFKQALLIGIALSFALLIFQISQQITTLFKAQLAIGWHLRTLFTASLFLFIWLYLPKRRWLLQTSLINVLTITSLSLCLALLAFNSLAASLVDHFPATFLSNTTTLPVKAQNVWPYFLWGWWLSLLPIISLYLVMISQGYTLRKVLIGFLVITGLVWLGWLFDPLQNILVHLPRKLIPWLCLSLILSFFYLSGIDFKLLLGTALQTPAKQQLQQRTFSQSLMRSIIVALALYLVGGLNLFAFISFVWLIPCFILLIAGLLNFTKLYKSRA